MVLYRFIEGGPGTGKSIVAVNLLAELTKYGQAVQYVSKNSAPRTVYQKKLQGVITKSSIDNMFKGSGGTYKKMMPTKDGTPKFQTDIEEITALNRDGELGLKVSYEFTGNIKYRKIPTCTVLLYLHKKSLFTVLLLR